MLKRCPFCGGKAVILPRHRGLGRINVVVVCESHSCTAIVGAEGRDDEEAARIWNRRAE